MPSIAVESLPTRKVRQPSAALLWYAPYEFIRVQSKSPEPVIVFAPQIRMYLRAG